MYSRYYVPTFHFDTRKPCYCGSMKLFGDCCASASENRTYPNSVKVIHNFVAQKDCDQMLKYAEKQKREWLTVVDSEKSTENKRVLKRHPSRVTQIVDLAKKRTQVVEWMARACKEHLPGHVEPQWFENPQMLRYGPGGKYAMHSDADNFCPEQRRFYRFIDRDFSMSSISDYSGQARAHKNIYRPLIKVKNSLRVACDSRNAPSITELFITEFCFCTPRIIIHIC
jgi:hypothetical protein